MIKTDKENLTIKDKGWIYIEEKMKEYMKDFSNNEFKGCKFIAFKIKTTDRSKFNLYIDFEEDKKPDLRKYLKNYIEEARTGMKAFEGKNNAQFHYYQGRFELAQFLIENSF